MNIAELISACSIQVAAGAVGSDEAVITIEHPDRSVRFRASTLDEGMEWCAKLKLTWLTALTMQGAELDREAAPVMAFCARYDATSDGERREDLDALFEDCLGADLPHAGLDVPHTFR